ncbi:hypothetical protein RRG08_060279 [Elysia crispata]|uniref:Uncharacterized protein n=1 Tax=Elysia crispata TaxID=231223 RepID=A0AAE1AEI2_9GAST|nr:hypothetical protein RRG08_060279 [Elysia crispata]
MVDWDCEQFLTNQRVNQRVNQPINRSTGRAEQADMEPQIDKPTASRPDLTSPLCSIAHLPTMLLFHRLRKQKQVSRPNTILAAGQFTGSSVRIEDLIVRSHTLEASSSSHNIDLGAQE